MPASPSGSPSTIACCRSCRCSMPTRGDCRTRRGTRARASSCRTGSSRPNRSRSSSNRSGPRSPARCRPSGPTCIATRRITRGWGMPEPSPLAARAYPPRGVELGTTEEMDWRANAGRVLSGVELRIVDDAGNPMPWDGEAVGEIEVRGPWVTASYYLDPATEKFDDGWLRTGDVGSVEPNGFIRITDRAKDVIKSGGEWISTVELENHLMAHPDVVEAAVIGVPDPKWDERPLACVVCTEGSSVDAAGLQSFLADKVAKWQVPERWAFIDEVPKTSVGKFDKKVLRARHTDHELSVEELG